MKSWKWLIAAWLIAALSGAGPVRADLASYLAKPEPSYKWEKRAEKKVDGGTVYDLHLVSQVWEGNTWEHRLQIFRPDKLDHPEFCGIYNTGGNGGQGDEAMGMALAKASGCVFASVFGNPKQPLYGGKTEDALIVYTWQKFLETGDEDWPLHFPMAKTVIKAMDAVQEFTKQSGMTPITGFVVTGASKRGWTTWLVGASGDPRVKAIAPMVIDTLNLRKQLPHQLEAFGGKPSEQIGDYSGAGILPLLQSHAADKLIQLEDPYSYVDKLTLPKLIILGTNDRYWAQDALNMYWDDLKGLKWVLYTPNSGHGLEDRARVYATLSAFIRATAAGKKWPAMKWAYETAGKDTVLVLSSTPKAQSARLFRTTATTQDFRDSRWAFTPMESSGRSFRATTPPPDEGYAAVFGEATYSIDGRSYTLSTQLRILGPQK